MSLTASLPSQPQEAYTGVELLEALQAAPRYNRFLTRLIQHHLDAPQGSELIDFGAGIGTFSAVLRDHGRTMICVEPDPALAARLGLEGYQVIPSLDSFADGTLPDVFTLNVLEHIEDDLNVMKSIHAKLKPGGRLFVYVPAYKCLWSKLDDEVCHFRRYTRGSLTQKLRDAGFDIEHSSYADSLGFAATLVYRLANFRRATPTAAMIANYDRCIFPFSKVVDFVIRPFIGKNVYALARKPRR